LYRFLKAVRQKNNLLIGESKGFLKDFLFCFGIKVLYKGKTSSTTDRIDLLKKLSDNSLIFRPSKKVKKMGPLICSRRDCKSQKTPDATATKTSRWYKENGKVTCGKYHQDNRKGLLEEQRS